MSATGYDCLYNAACFRTGGEKSVVSKEFWQRFPARPVWVPGPEIIDEVPASHECRAVMSAHDAAPVISHPDSGNERGLVTKLESCLDNGH